MLSQGDQLRRVKVEQNRLLTREVGFRCLGKHHIGVITAEMNPLQFSRGSQITANFHAEEPVKVDGALYVGDVSHRNEAGYFGWHGVQLRCFSSLSLALLAQGTAEAAVPT